MALNTFGWTPAEVTTDSAGNVIAGVTLTVFTDVTKSNQVTGLFDKDGTTAIPSGVVVSDSKGRFGFKASDAFSMLYVWDGSTSDPWPIAAHEALDQGMASHAQAVADAQAAADSAAASAALVGAPADSAIATAVNGTGTQTRGALDGRYVPQGVTGTTIPTALTITALQAAADTAAANGTRLVASGTITTSTPLTLACDADLSLLTINYTGTGAAVLVGTRSRTSWIIRKAIKTPIVVATAKTVPGWAQVAGVIGVEIANAYSCTVTVPRVNNAEVGLRLAGYAQGVGYCTIHLGQLDNNKTNLHVTQGDVDGWVNQNTFVGGRLSNESAEGESVAGVAAVRIDPMTTHPSNNNTWLGTSLEGNAPEWHADVSGATNMFVNCRWETTGAVLPKVRWRVGATGNSILYGYLSNQIVETVEAGSGGVVCSNIILSRGAWKLGTGNSAAGLLLLENTGGSTQPTDVVMAPGGRLAGSNPASAFTVARSSDQTLHKRSTDANARLRIDHQNGRVYVGNGVAAPVAYVGAYGAASIGVDGGSVGFPTDNTWDIGMSSARPRYVRTGTAVQVGAFATGSRPTAATAGAGAMIFDSTLNKPVWSTGSAWVDATGAAV